MHTTGKRKASTPPNKTQCIFIGNRQLLSRIPNNTTIKLNGTTITPSNHVKNLGLYIDRYMSFDVHINELNKKIMGTLTYMNRLSDNFQKTTRVIIVSSLVLSIINYCIRIWGSTKETFLYSAQNYRTLLLKLLSVGCENMIMFLLL